MKRVLTFVILLLSVIAVYAGGIGNAKDLVAFAKAVNKGEDISAWQNDKGEVCLAGDIDMAEVKIWQPIKEFKGVFDGRGHALKNWTTSQGIFELLPDSAEVRNLRIDASCAMEITSEGEISVGFIAGVSMGMVENCENCAPIHYKAVATDSHISIGGLVGQNGYVVIDSRNSGAITIEAFIDSTNQKQAIYVGGIAGRTTPKSRAYYTLNRCENSGTITYKGDIPRPYIAGVIGRSYRADIRLCVNRGDIDATFAEGMAGIKGYNYIAGVVGHTDQHIQCSDNFGKITFESIFSTIAGGICGAVSEARNIVGCSNYGDVVSNCTNTSFFAGVLGVSKMGAHITNCYNYGKVRFVASHSDDLTYFGGIAGCLVSKKGLQYGTYMRRCTNYGDVKSRIYSERLRMGGVAGYVSGSEIAPIKIVDCGNSGIVTAENLPAEDISSRLKHATVEGEAFHNNYAQAVEEKSGEYNLYGRVTSTTGEPLAGVVMSDGEYCVQTDNNGYYKIKSDLNKARFVTISTPSGYKFSFRKAVQQNFKRIPRHAEAVVANFVLEKREKPLDKYTVIMMGDPQIRGVGVDSAVYRLKNFVYPDVVALKKEKKATDEDFFAINLGDLVFNDMTKFDDFLDCASQSGFQMFNAIGNHDFGQATILDARYGTMHFEEYFHPVNYSFNIGKTHYIILNNLTWNRKTTKVPYYIGLDDWTCDWLERDLQFVPKDHTIVVCTHGQLFRFPLPVHLVLPVTPDEYARHRINYDRYSKIFEPYSKVYSWSGHYHYNFGYDYKESEVMPNLKNVVSICVARCCGGLHVSRELYNDGTPQGYMVVEVDGDNFEWYYKTVGYDRSHQMNVYSPTRNGSEFVKATIWNWSADYWTTPEWWENGKKVADMINKPEKDVAYLENYAKYGPFLGRKGDDKAVPHPAHGTFHIKPSEGVRSGEVRVTDNFGVTYTQKVEW